MGHPQTADGGRMFSETRIGFIGSGKMAEAMIGGLISKQLCSPEQIIASGPRQERATALQAQYGICATTDNAEAAAAQIIVLGVKPQVFPSVCTELGETMSDDALIVSIAAGVTLESIKASLPCSHIVRAMPNTPGRIGKGVTTWTAAAQVTKPERAKAAALLGALGMQRYVEQEKYIDMATALAGSGPAYVFLFMESLVDVGVQMGLSRNLAEDLVLGTVHGAAAYAQQADRHLAQLRNDVTSPGGTTAAALQTLELGGFRGAVAQAVLSAYHRSIELGKG